MTKLLMLVVCLTAMLVMVPRTCEGCCRQEKDFLNYVKKECDPKIHTNCKTVIENAEDDYNRCKF